MNTIYLGICFTLKLKILSRWNLYYLNIWSVKLKWKTNILDVKAQFPKVFMSFTSQRKFDTKKDFSCNVGHFDKSDSPHLESPSDFDKSRLYALTNDVYINQLNKAKNWNSSVNFKRTWRDVGYLTFVLLFLHISMLLTIRK